MVGVAHSSTAPVGYFGEVLRYTCKIGRDFEHMSVFRVLCRDSPMCSGKALYMYCVHFHQARKELAWPGHLARNDVSPANG